MKLKKFRVKNFRSLINVEIEFVNGFPVVITGENNIGKTNFLRALNVFFNHLKSPELYDKKLDIPHHIYYGSRGGRNKTEFFASFDDNGAAKEVHVLFKDNEISYKINGKKTDSEDFSLFIDNFCLFFIESHNIHLPSLIGTILEEDGLLPLDKKRRKQHDSLKKLKEFVDLSKKAIDDIQKNINIFFKELTNFDGFLKDAEIAINFVEFERLRDILRTMTSITLNDGNNHVIESKGSGAQRAVFLSLMQYISSNIKGKQIIWAIDEPEAFLQPKLQKKVFDTLNSMCNSNDQIIILTTHSQYFININKPDSINLFKGASELKLYERRPGVKFHEINTQNILFRTLYEKMQAIKEHLGIQSNDSWEIFPFNIIVEGECDKRYLEFFFTALGKEIPRIIFSGGASKIAGELQYFENIANNSSFQSMPKVICIFDNDTEGKNELRKIKPYNYKNIEIEAVFIPRCDGFTTNSSDFNWEIEDFIPIKLIVKAANLVLKKNGYIEISDEQIKARFQEAHMRKNILLYLTECINHNNPSVSFNFEHLGRKKELCSILCESINLTEAKNELQQHHLDFLNRISSLNII